MEEILISEDENKLLVTKVEKEKKITFSTRDSVMAYIMLALGFVFIRFVLWNVTGVFTTIFFVATTITCMIYMKASSYKLGRNQMVQFGLILIFSLVFSITANDFIKFLDTAFVLTLGVYWVYSVCKGEDQIGRFLFFEMLKAIFVMPFSGFGKAPKAIAYSTSNSKHTNNIKLAIMGLVMTIPLTVIVGGLLASADSGVENMLGTLFGSIHGNIVYIILQFLMGIPVAFYLFGMLYSNINKEHQAILKEEECSQMMISMRVAPNLAMYSAVTPICALYIMFFVSQLQYFLSAFLGRLPEEYSFSEYARRGFFELCAIAIINLIVYVIINLFSQHTGEKKPIMLKIYSALLAVFTLLIITTALSKMILYIRQFGLTQLRVYTCWFMILLLFIFIMIIWKQFNYYFNFAKCFVITFIVLFSVLCFSNIDGIISKYNIEMYKVGNLQELDVEALCNLSDDGVLYVLEEGIDTKEYLEDRLYRYKYNPYNKYNLSSFRVMHLLENEEKVK